jgi:hypothetical protein
VDWDAAGRGFTRECDEEQFKEPLERGLDWRIEIGYEN